MAIASGSPLEPFEIIAPLGSGGMGDVYRAPDPRLGRDVAVKVLPPEYAGASGIRETLRSLDKVIFEFHYPSGHRQAGVRALESEGVSW